MVEIIIDCQQYKVFKIEPKICSMFLLDHWVHEITGIYFDVEGVPIITTDGKEIPQSAIIAADDSLYIRHIIYNNVNYDLRLPGMAEKLYRMLETELALDALE